MNKRCYGYPFEMILDEIGILVSQEVFKQMRNCETGIDHFAGRGYHTEAKDCINHGEPHALRGDHCFLTPDNKEMVLCDIRWLYYEQISRFIQITV